jgi:hypothetical protein
MKVVRRHGVTPSPNSPVTLQQTFGEVLVARIGARGKGDYAAPLAISGTGWTRSLKTAPGGNRLALTITRGPYAESEFDARGTIGTVANYRPAIRHNGERSCTAIACRRRFAHERSRCSKHTGGAKNARDSGLQSRRPLHIFSLNERQHPA